MESFALVPLRIEYDRPVRTEYKLVAQMRVDNPSATLEDIAKAIGYSTASLRHWIRTPEYQRYETFLVTKTLNDIPAEQLEARKRVQEQFQDYATYMQERLVSILETTASETLQTRIAQDWLDRSGFPAVRARETRGITLHLTADVVEMLQRRSEEAGL